MLAKVARGRGNEARREIPGAFAEGCRMSAELILLSVVYLGVMGGVFTKGVQGAVRVHRDARMDD